LQKKRLIIGGQTHSHQPESVNSVENNVQQNDHGKQPMNSNDRKYAILLEPPVGIRIVEKPANEPLYTFCEKSCECECIEVVHPKGLKYPNTMLVDESGLLKENQVLNVLASYLYETRKHGNPIVGKVLVVNETMTNSGIDLQLLSSAEVIQLRDFLSGLILKAANALT
jgi:hypothetical protein